LKYRGRPKWRLKSDALRQACVISTPASEKSIRIFKPAFSPHFHTGTDKNQQLAIPIAQKASLLTKPRHRLGKHRLAQSRNATSRSQRKMTTDFTDGMDKKRRVFHPCNPGNPWSKIS
jgi:hypothetical protein